jgi:hypothetical protein
MGLILVLVFGPWMLAVVDFLTWRYLGLQMSPVNWMSWQGLVLGLWPIAVTAVALVRSKFSN